MSIYVIAKRRSVQWWWGIKTYQSSFYFKLILVKAHFKSWHSLLVRGSKRHRVRVSAQKELVNKHNKLGGRTIDWTYNNWSVRHGYPNVSGGFVADHFLHLHLLCVRYRREVARHRYSDGSLPQNGPIVPGLLSQEQIDLMLGEPVLQADILNYWESQVAKHIFYE